MKLIQIWKNLLQGNVAVISAKGKRAFKEEWENKYMILLKPNSSEQGAACAICSKEMKSYAMQRHCTTHEQEVQTMYGNPVTRRTRLAKVKNELIQQQNKMNIFLSRNDELHLATLKACFIIGKHRKPFSDGEFIKSLVLAVEPENRLFRDMPLTNDTVQQRIKKLCIFICNEIAQCVNKSPFFSLSLDESNDITKPAQIIVCVRYFDVDECLFRERLLCITYLTERPNAKNIYIAVKRGLDFLNVSTKNMCAITADGAATMKSERNGVLSLFDKESDSDVFQLHCFVHQEVLK
jgi:hypothetical protein